LQQAPEGGFAGRTNKLVDACYSWWVGGCWALIEAASGRPAIAQPIWNRGISSITISNLDALAKYLLSCCQYEVGGMRDKPPMRPDFYHTCYSLAGLSATQHHYTYNESSTEEETAFKWTVEDKVEGEEGDRIAKIHPLFALPWGDAERIRSWFVKKGPVVSKDS
jgi:protein farnesyltransferase subunit beta